MLPRIVLIHYSSRSEYSSKLDYCFLEKTNSKIEDIELLVGRIYSMRNFQEWFKKKWNCWHDQQKVTKSLQGLSFVWGFSRGLIHFFRTKLARSFRFCQYFQEKSRNLHRLFTKVFFLDHQALFFWNIPLINR